MERGRCRPVPVVEQFPLYLAACDPFSQVYSPNWARWPGLQDDSRIRYLEIMYAKFWPNTDVCQIDSIQIDSIQLEHGFRRLRERYRSREEIRRERKGLFFLCAKQGQFQWSRKATVRYDTDKNQSEDKSFPLSAQHDIEHYSSHG
jgi:hypothetical protein